MLRQIQELQAALGIDYPVLLRMAREVSGDADLRCLEDLFSEDMRALLSDLLAMSVQGEPVAA